MKKTVVAPIFVFSLIIAVICSIVIGTRMNNPTKADYEELKMCADYIVTSIYSENSSETFVNVLSNSNIRSLQYEDVVDGRIIVNVILYSTNKNNWIEVLYPAKVDENGKTEVGIDFSIVKQGKLTMYRIIPVFISVLVISFILILIIRVLIIKIRRRKKLKK